MLCLWTWWLDRYPTSNSWVSLSSSRQPLLAMYTHSSSAVSTSVLSDWRPPVSNLTHSSLWILQEKDGDGLLPVPSIPTCWRCSLHIWNAYIWKEVGSGMFKTQRIPKHPLFWLKFNTQQSLEKLVCLRVDESQTVEKEQDVKASDYLNWKLLRYKFQQSTAVLHLQASERTE